MHDKRIKIDLLKELQASIIPSNAEIENILKEFNSLNEEDEKVEDDEILRQKAIKTELKLSGKSKKLKSEMRSFSNLETLSLTQTAGISGKSKDHFGLVPQPSSTVPFFRTKSIAPKSAGKM